MTPGRDLLLKVQKAFLDHGYHQMTMVGLSRACGFSRRSLYNYFPNKDDAFRAMFRQFNLDIIDRAWSKGRALEAEGADVLDILAGIIDIRYGDVWRLIEASPHAAEMKGTSFALCPDIMVELARGFQDDLEDLVAECVADGRLTLKSEFTAAKLVQMLTDSARGVNQVYPSAPLDQLYGQYRDNCRAILFGYAVDA